MSGCESLPGGEKEQGAVIGGVGGAAAGAAIGGKDHRVGGAVIGGVLGAAGGYLIGSQMEKNNDEHKDEAVEASRRAERDPAKVSDVRRASTADLNDDGFVTMDEVIAMEEAGLSDREMIRRLEATQQVFALTDDQEDRLRDAGVSREVILEMREMNRDLGDSARTASDRNEVLSRDRD